MSSSRVLIYLLRRDLRLADNPVFHEISKLSQQSHHPFTHLLPIYVFPAQQVEVSGFLSSADEVCPFPEARSQVGGFWRCGPLRAKFVAESVWDLKSSLERVGSGLTVRVGMVGQILTALLQHFKATGDLDVYGVWMTSEEGVEEKREERDARRAVEEAGTDFRLWRDEKYFIDEYELPSICLLVKTNPSQPRCALQQAQRPSRCLH
jgi:deoxyribodipyrimidine photo-lyase